MSQIGDTALRAEVVDRVIKKFTNLSYKFKQALSISTTNAWKNTYYTEASAALVGKTGNAVKGIPRGANFPQATVEWVKKSAWLEKYGLEDNIFWEDILTNDIDVQSRTLFKIAEGVVAGVDGEIWDVLTENQAATPTDIQHFTISGNRHWDVASAAIIDDLMRAKQMLAEFNYPTSNLQCFISPKDHRSIVKYLADSGAQFPSIGEDMAKNGRVGKLVGIQLIQSNNVTASMALVVVPKICGTWKSAVPLTTNTTVDPFKSVRIRAVEIGVTQLHQPKAVVRIAGTQS